LDTVVLVPLLDWLRVSEPKREVVVVVGPSRTMRPEPKGEVVTVCPFGPLVIAPLPKVLVVYVLPSEERVIHPLPNLVVRKVVPSAVRVT
jgi:hypothetical protein